MSSFEKIPGSPPANSFAGAGAAADQVNAGGKTSVARRLYDSARTIWEGYHCHPFVTGMGDGSLSMDKFRFFLLQDYLYLFDYAKVFALGVVKARDPRLMREFSANVDAILNGEMKIHKAYMARLGITEEQVLKVRPALANLSYTNYMLSVAFAGGPAEIVATILACSWSYQEIGSRLARRPGAAEHEFFGEWISGYASAEYAATNEGLIRLTDRLSADYKEEEIQNLTDIFLNCSRYEAGFWDMAWNMEY